MIDYTKIPSNFKFELDDNGELYSVSATKGEFSNAQKSEVSALVNEWLKKDLIEVGDKTECSVIKENDHFKISGHVCIEWGEDESKDEWENFELKILF